MHVIQMAVVVGVAPRPLPHQLFEALHLWSRITQQNNLLWILSEVHYYKHSDTHLHTEHDQNDFPFRCHDYREPKVRPSRSGLARRGGGRGLARRSVLAESLKWDQLFAHSSLIITRVHANSTLKLIHSVLLASSNVQRQPATGTQWYPIKWPTNQTAHAKVRVTRWLWHDNTHCEKGFMGCL